MCTIYMATRFFFSFPPRGQPSEGKGEHKRRGCRSACGAGAASRRAWSGPSSSCRAWCSRSPPSPVTVGYHELAGTKVTLKKPLLVLRKKKVSGLDHRPFGPAFCWKQIIVCWGYQLYMTRTVQKTSVKPRQLQQPRTRDTPSSIHPVKEQQSKQKASRQG
jgi:hypothetical protein